VFGSRGARRRRSQDEGERPFWISFADLMSALMVLFLVVMASTIVRLTNEQSAEKDKKQQARDTLKKRFASLAQRNELEFDTTTFRFNLRQLATFSDTTAVLSRTQADALRSIMPEFLDSLGDSLASREVVRVDIEGYASLKGAENENFGYLGNLNLSLRRAEGFLCELLDSTLTERPVLSNKHKRLIRQKFFVGGFSFNDAQQTDSLSRRIALRIILRQPSADSLPPIPDNVAYGQCKRKQSS